MIRTLIAESDSATRKALSLLLQCKMTSVLISEAQDVESLIRLFADTPPDILLLDWRLYGSPAPETCRLLKKAYPDLKVVLLSLDARDKFTACAAGADFVHKGAGPEALITTLHTLTACT